MKSFIFILIALLAIQATYAQEDEGQIGEPFTPEDEGEIGEAFFEEINEEDEGEIGTAFEETADFVEVPLDQFLNDEFSQSVVKFCNQWIISQLIGFAQIANDTNWKQDQVNWVEFSRQQNIWIINIRYIDDQNDAFDAEFHVRSSNFISPSIVIESSTYTILNGDTEEESVLVSVAPEEEETTFARLLQDEETEEEAIPWLATWSSLNVTESQEDPNIQALIDLGVASAIDTGLSQGILPEGDWRLWFVEAIERQFDAGAKYLFYVTLTGPAEAKGAVFVFQPLNGSPWVISSGFWSLTPGSA